MSDRAPIRPRVHGARGAVRRSPERVRFVLPALVAILVLRLAPAAVAQPAGDEAPRPLTVATKVAEPLVTEAGGELGGISIELWRRIAERLELDYAFEVTTLEELLDGVAEGRFDAGIAAITVTPDREARMDMTHGYYMDGLGIAVAAGAGGPSWLRGFANVFTWGFASAIGALGLLLLIVGLVVWLVERGRNAEQFPRDAARGIGDGFWFAAVTMTTVGYGDKAPRSLPGRLVALVWMFGSIIVISAFTGAIASSLTAAQISGAVRGPEDLRGARVGAPEASATVEALRARGVTARAYASVDAGLAALAEGSIDAFVHDRSLLRYRVGRDFAGALHVLEAQFEMGWYAIALPSGSPLREPLNREILAITREPEWDDVLARALGAAGP